jgi:hypothetical protein
MYELHEMLQVIMGWMNSHLFMFRQDHLVIAEECDDDDWFVGEFRDARKTKVRDVLSSPGDQVIYEYDFGDSWEHTVMLEKIAQERGVEFSVPRCLDGENACPPEDCGGVPGFERLKEILSDPKHEEHLDMIGWLDTYYPNYDPKEFSLGQVNRILNIGAGRYLRIAQRFYS